MNSVTSLKHYALPLVLQTLITILSTLFTESLGMVNIALIHLIPVLVIAIRGDMTATMIIASISVILFDLLYVPPRYSFNVQDLMYAWSFILFYVVGYIITIQARRLHATAIKDILLHTLSHDLKTPLSSILGNTSILLQKRPLAEKDRNDIILQIKNSGQHMNRLILNLLDSARLQNSRSFLRKEWCDFEDMLGVALQEFDQEPDAILLSIDPELRLFWGDGALLTRLLVNLLDNGLKYSYENRPVRISIIYTPSEVRIVFFNESSPIKKADLKNMFEKFYRLDNTVDMGGSGIGLSICKDIVVAHNGTIEAYNGNGGLTVEVTLPVSKHPGNTPKELL